MIVKTLVGYGDNEHEEEDDVPDEVIKDAATYCYETGNAAFVGYDKTTERWNFCDDEDIGRVDSFAFGWPCDWRFSDVVLLLTKQHQTAA